MKNNQYIYKLYHNNTSKEFFFKTNPNKLKILDLVKIIGLDDCEGIIYAFEEAINDGCADIPSDKEILDWVEINITMKNLFDLENLEVTKVKLNE